MSDPCIAFIRETTLLSDVLVEQYVEAQKIQIARDFGPAWSAGATCVFVPPGGTIPAGAWQVVFLDHSDQADALGYHDTTAPGGMPRSKVFVADDLESGNSWTVTASHETLEMLADPDISKTTRVSLPDGTINEYAWEICDCCEDDRFAYPIKGIHLSDFALPSWFDPAADGPYTFRDTVDAPLALAEGGYIGVHEVSPLVTPWQQCMARGEPGSRTAKGVASRTSRRFSGAGEGQSAIALSGTFKARESRDQTKA
jgi:hypothetical protein